MIWYEYDGQMAHRKIICHHAFQSELVNTRWTPTDGAKFIASRVVVNKFWIYSVSVRPSYHVQCIKNCFSIPSNSTWIYTYNINGYLSQCTIELYSKSYIYCRPNNVLFFFFYRIEMRWRQQQQQRPPQTRPANGFCEYVCWTIWDKFQLGIRYYIGVDWV